MRVFLTELKIDEPEVVLDTPGIQIWVIVELVHSGSERKSNFEEGTVVADG